MVKRVKVYNLFGSQPIKTSNFVFVVWVGHTEPGNYLSRSVARFAENIANSAEVKLEFGLRFKIVF